MNHIARNLLVTALVAYAVAAAGATAQTPQTPPAPSPQVRPEAFPAQQRPPGDPAVVARGKTLYDINCSLCHGADLRGGQLNGVNLLRSLVTLADQAGELIIPIVHGSRADKGMPPLPLPDEDVKAVAEYIHSVLALSPRQGMPPPGGVAPTLNVLVGDAGAGEKYFAAKCSSCHSPAGDLQGIATRISDAKALQNQWISGGAAGRGGRGPSTGSGRASGGVTVTVTLPSGEKATGRLFRIDDFLVSLMEEDGTVRSFSRRGGVPAVEIQDPLDPHRQLLAIYTDKDMHDVTAYLATLK